MTSSSGGQPAFALAVETGQGQSAYLDQLLSQPVTVQLTGSGGAPVTGAGLTVTAPRGGVAQPVSGMTDAQGRFTVQLRLARNPGSQTFVVAAPAQGVQVNVQATALVPEPGMLFTVVNVTHMQGMQAPGAAAPGTTSVIPPPTALAVATDGTVYFSTAWLPPGQAYNCAVYRLDPSGVLDTIAGNGTCTDAGDDGAASMATVGVVSSMALDEVANVLYLGRNVLVRAVDLTSLQITRFAGGGTATMAPFGDGGQATDATFGIISHLLVRPMDGTVFVSDRGRPSVRTVAPDGIVRTALGASGCGAGWRFYGCPGGGCPLALDAAGSLFVGCIACDPTGNLPAAVLRVNSDGTFTHVAGAGTSGSTVDGIDARLARMSSQRFGMAFDPAGNLYATELLPPAVRRIDSQTGQFFTVAGTGIAGTGADYAVGGALNVPNPGAFDGNMHFYLPDTGSNSVRVVSALGRAAPAPATFGIASGNNQTVYVGQQVSLGARLADAQNNPLVNFAVDWVATEAGSNLLTRRSSTDNTGVALANARAGVFVGDWHVDGLFMDIHGAPLALPRWTIHATAPPVGSVFSLVNVNHQFINPSPVPAPAQAAQVGPITDLTVAQDGTVYFASAWSSTSNCFVYRLTQAGVVERVAGTPAPNNPTLVNCGHAGEDVSALDAQVKTGFSGGLALDEARQKLYVAAFDRIRVIDLVTGNIRTLAGGGSAPAPDYGDGGQATLADVRVNRISVRPSDGWVFFADKNRIRYVDPSTGTIGAWLTPVGNNGCDTGVRLYQVGANAGVTFDGAETAYVSADLCGPWGTSNLGKGVLRRNMDGTFTHVAGRGGGGSTAEGIAATDASFTSDPIVMFGQGGQLFLADTGGNRVRTVTGGVISTVYGTGTLGIAAEYGTATAEPAYHPTGIAISRGRDPGHLLVGEGGQEASGLSASIRVVW